MSPETWQNVAALAFAAMIVKQCFELVLAVIDRKKNGSSTNGGGYTQALFNIQSEMTVRLDKLRDHFDTRIDELQKSFEDKYAALEFNIHNK